MDIKYIYSKRNFEDAFYWGIVFEWEDDIARTMGLSIYKEYSNNYNYYCLRYKTIRRILKYIPYFKHFVFPQQMGLVFDMSPKLNRKRLNEEHIVPLIIDFFLLENDLPQLNNAYRGYPIVLISSRQAYDFLEKNRSLCPDCVFKHLALSLPDKYCITSQTNFKKKYDVIMAGRQNPILEAYFFEYVKTHPEISYVYRKQKKEDEFEYYSNKGEYIGVITNRDEYMELLRLGKIAFYMTPDVDTNHMRSHGYNQVTPRFLEFMASGMHVLARYIPNSDTEYYQLQEFSTFIQTYEEFEQAMNFALTHEVDMKKYANYLAKHYTSVRAQELKQLISKI